MKYFFLLEDVRVAQLFLTLQNLLVDWLQFFRQHQKQLKEVVVKSHHEIFVLLDDIILVRVATIDQLEFT
jgi:hypothetical protein